MTKTRFITGCSTGFGRAIAKHLIALGHNVAVTARSPAQVADVVAEHPNTTMAIKLDVTDQAQIDAAVGMATQRFGAIDVLWSLQVPLR